MLFKYWTGRWRQRCRRIPSFFTPEIATPLLTAPRLARPKTPFDSPVQSGVCLIPPKDAVLHPEIRLPRLRKRFVLGDLRAEHFPTVEMPRRSNATHQPSDRPVQVGASRVRDRSGS